MSDIKNKLDSEKDKVMGITKENIGKATGSEETELKGNIQSQKGELKEQLDNFKEKIAKKINDKINEKDENKE